MCADHGSSRVQGLDAGFTLLEMLIAFAIAALAVVALLQSSLAGLRASQIAGRYEEALARARSRLAALEATPIVAGDLRGEDGGGYHWRVRIVALARSGASGRLMTDQSAGLTLYAVTVAVGWQDGGQAREVQLQTQRLGPATAAAP